MLCRNATINEDANCTHYLDDDEARGKQCEQERGAESTEDEGGSSGESEGEGAGEDQWHGYEGDEYRKDDHESYTSMPPPQEAVKCDNIDNCDVSGDQQRPGSGRPPASTCWCAED